ncbi:Retrovirus-related Pol polyprotein from transposon, partial [Aduncisulcus paluster]
LVPLKKKTATSVADAFVERICLRYMIPVSIHSDNGSEFDNSVFKLTCKRLNIFHYFATTHNPRSMGMVERLNGLVKKSLKQLKATHTEGTLDLERLVPAVQSDLNHRKHRVLRHSPSEMVFGKTLKSSPTANRLFQDLDPRLTAMTYKTYVDELSDSLTKLHDTCRERQ